MSSSKSRRADCTYTFGPFALDVGSKVLTRDDRVIPLTPKVYETLLLLLERDGGVLSKDVLMETSWPDTYVDEANITQNIAVLRKALGNGQQYVETVPKRGYRFAAEIRKIKAVGLPHPTTSFVGRTSEKESARDLLLGEARLLTLIGVGGTGKTRLALEVAFDVAGMSPDGIF